MPLILNTLKHKFTPHFSVCIVDCEWEEYVPGECSLDCGGGVRPMVREIKQEAAYGGKECEGDAHGYEDCNMQCCPGNSI